MAESRFESLCKKLNKNPDMRSRYETEMNGYIAKGHARRLSPEEAELKSDQTYYLPHHGVVNPKKPKKLRVVFDAAAKYSGHSLNSKLISGPDLTNNLAGVLMRFRKGVIAMAADIEGMFHNVRVPTSDQDSLRFLWKDHLESPDPPSEYQMCVHIFGAKCSPCCASYALKRVAIDNLEYSRLARETILRQYYVDDMLRGFDGTPLEATSLALELIDLNSRGGFKLTKWASNCPELLEAVASVDGIKTHLKLDLDGSVITRTLGIACDLTHDIFIFDTVSLPTVETLTKRILLSIVSTVFDPLGFLAPFIVRAKILLQSLWEKGLNWDDPIPLDEYLKWETWLSELEDLRLFSLRRCFWPNGLIPMIFNLHVFCDASEQAFGAVAYLQLISSQGLVHCTIIMAKTRVAPVRKNRLTLPRLELQAAVLAVRLFRTIREEIDVQLTAVYLWSDSSIVLHCIRNDSKRFKTFVANRIAEIRQETNPFQWRHVPSQLNPADDCSRGLLANEIRPGHRWLEGPEFLHCVNENGWPSQSVLNRELDLESSEVVNEVKHTAVISTVGLQHSVVDISKFSSLVPLKCVVAWCFRFIHNVRNKNREVGRLSIAELNKATLYLVKVAQHEMFGEEIRLLSEGKTLPRGSPLYKLKPGLNGHLLRVGGRVDSARMPYAARHQLLLPKKHVVTELIVQDVHRNLLHSGVEHVVSSLRRGFWIPAIRQIAFYSSTRVS
ncbi:uncharacterized protein LOC135500838 [Lineus longissimus]|uniref:uncharacterized protein LOC135500838 n=1 Tax=Lineus longissimus TaxID=88925 RepID=UPI00315D1228